MKDDGIVCSGEDCTLHNVGPDDVGLYQCFVGESLDVEFLDKEVLLSLGNFFFILHIHGDMLLMENSCNNFLLVTTLEM